MVHDLRALVRLAKGKKAQPDRTQVAQLTEEVQGVTENSVEIAFVDQGYTGDRAAQAAAQNGIDLVVVKLPEAQKGFSLLPKRWVVERSFAWTTRFRRLVRNYERTPEVLCGLHFVAFVVLMFQQLINTLTLTRRSV
jgi:transposase